MVGYKTKFVLQKIKWHYPNTTTTIIGQFMPHRLLRVKTREFCFINSKTAEQRLPQFSLISCPSTV